jgi:hypothetical protein
MTNPLRLSLLACATLAATTLSSCVYDPYYRSSVSTGVGYSSGHFSTSMMVRTSDNHWFYDPDCLSYYDTRRNCYYDPYLHGYYPVGCRPPRIYGAPHPYGWHRGASVCRPPSQVRTTWINNHQDRYRSYCNLNQSWSHQVRRGDDDDRNNNSWNHNDDSRHDGRPNGNAWGYSNNHGSSRDPWNRGNNQGNPRVEPRTEVERPTVERPDHNRHNRVETSNPPVTREPREPRGHSGGSERPEKTHTEKPSRPEKTHSEKPERGNSKHKDEGAMRNAEPRQDSIASNSKRRKDDF